MEAYEVIETLKSLAKRIDPLTGAEIPLNHPYGNVKVMRAFNKAVSLLEQAYIHTDEKKELGERQPAQPKWKQLDHERVSVAQGKVEVKAAAKVKPANAGKTWDKEEEDTLIREYQEGKTISELAKSHERTKVAIESRLKRLGFMVPEYRQEEGLE
jgi:predicted HNH restriction endonuclease